MPAAAPARVARPPHRRPSVWRRPRACHRPPARRPPLPYLYRCASATAARDPTVHTAPTPAPSKIGLPFQPAVATARPLLARAARSRRAPGLCAGVHLEVPRRLQADAAPSAQVHQPHGPSVRARAPRAATQRPGRRPSVRRRHNDNVALAHAITRAPGALARRLCIIDESPDMTPLLRPRFHRRNPNCLATVEMDSPKFIILDIRQPSLPVTVIDHHLETSKNCVSAITWGPRSAVSLASGGGDGCLALIWNISSLSKRVDDPALSHCAVASISNLQWAPSSSEWIALTVEDRLQALRL
ncbi:unnamed protein product [Chondrus crispus]|uniref:Uncharacterized protein n=1 Tax=Chondrus crispus TaxID=2769 RepID=R7Q8N2_CHOCR|nr:unnamed protein product [Chondrus crispus]CDF34158.1 unnamed protein product [Chondrus crispus]|eukprot:XP_005713977.1 unnamed protein product [Chondrus crispus]